MASSNAPLTAFSAFSITSSLPTAPALPPPPGVTPNFTNPETLWKWNVVAQTLCMTLAGALFILRTYVRLGFGKVRRQWITEDWMVCLSFIGLATYSGILSRIMAIKGGAHEWDLTVEQAHKISYIFWIESIVYGIFISLTKFSICLLYLRVFVPQRYGIMWWIIHVYLAVCWMFYFSITVAKIVQCEPRNRAWNKDIPGHCIDLPVLLSASGFFNIISDAFLLLIPVKAVWTLRMTLRRKFGVCLVFGIGAVAPVFSIIGFVVRVETASNKDETRNQPLILLWATAEITTGVICACLPTLPALFRRHIRKTNRVNENSGSTLGPKRRTWSTSHEDEVPQHREYRELEDYHVQLRGIQHPSKALTVDIKGGHSGRDRLRLTSPKESTERLAQESEEEQDFTHGIMRTVEIEQVNN